MHRIDADAHVSNQFSDGDAGIGQPGTKVDAAWLNAVQEALAVIIESAGLTLAKGDNTQLDDAVRAIVAASHAAAWTNIGAGGSSFGSGWGAGSETPQFYKDSAGWVHFRGRVLAGVAPNPAAIVMPTGLVPLGVTQHLVVLWNVATTAVSQTTTYGSLSGAPGQIRPATFVATDEIVLDGLSYYAG